MTADHKPDLAAYHLLAREVKQRGLQSLIDAVIAGRIELPEAVEICRMPVDEQERLSQCGFKIEESRCVVSEIERIWQTASVQEQSAALGRLAEIFGLIVSPAKQGALFPDAVVPKTKSVRTKPTDAEFETFWKAYPRNTNKMKARESFTKAVAFLCVENSIDAAVAIIVAGAGVYAQNVTDVVCHATTWLNGHRWEDDYGVKTTGKRSYREFVERTPEELAVF